MQEETCSCCNVRVDHLPAACYRCVGMEVFEHFRQMQAQRPTALTIGSFDGLHRGHQLLLKQTRRQAQRHGLSAGVVTFNPHPARLLAPRYAPALLMPDSRRLRAFSYLGFEWVLEQRFDEQFASLAAGRFAAEVLGRACRAELVVVGDDFSFGREREGDAALLVKLGRRHGFTVEVVERLSVSGMVVSSTKIRSFLLQGRVAGAAMLLGRPYVLEGRVVAGEQRGRQLGFPTLNLDTPAEVVPASGVYAGFYWPAGRRQGLAAVTNIGTRPTFGGKATRVEVHLPGQRLPDLRGSGGRLGFLERLRAEQRFARVDLLVGQIRRDIENALQVTAAHGHWQDLSPLDGFQT